MKTLIRSAVLFFFVVSAVPSVVAQLQWPVITATQKPWTRWWWEGSAVTKAGLSYNLEQYQKVGLGGVEITPIYGIKGYEKQFIPFLSNDWMAMLSHTLQTSKKLGLGVDLANATGWPFGGPWVSDDDASKTIYAKTYTLKGGQTLNTPIVYERKAFVRPASPNDLRMEQVKFPLSANTDLQSLAIDQVWFGGNLPLRTLMAYNEKGISIDITKYVDTKGQLQWIAPDGDWILYGLFEGLHGKMVERAAPGGEGYAIDHFSKTAATNYFKKFDEAFKGYDLSYLRAFFNDSYELDDAREQANWTSNLFTRFNQLHGYDLRTQLPALFGKGSPDQISRVTYDYRTVIDALVLEAFTMPWKQWAKQQGKQVRNQSHGSPANTLDLYSVVDIPETEGTELLRFKFASSAAHVSGKRLTSAESATWLNEHFLSSLGDVKKAIDRYFIGGVNHIVYHGVAYSPKEAPWPGWLFYAAVHFQETNPQWKDFKALNTYIARVQSFLQAGKSDADILVYYPIADRYSMPGNALLQHFDGMEKNFDRTPFEHISQYMLESGYTFDFFSDRQLQSFKVSGNKILTGDHAYRVILLPANDYIPLASMQKLNALVKAGATVLFYQKLPSKVPGFADVIRKQNELNTLTLPVLKKLNEATSVTVSNGKGRWIVAQDVDALLKEGGIRKESMLAQGLRFERRQLPQGPFYFIENIQQKNFEGWVELNKIGSAAVLYDAMGDRIGLAKLSQEGGHAKVWLQLQAGETVMVQWQALPNSAKAFPYHTPVGPPQEIKGRWTLQFLEGGPSRPPVQELNQLVSWTTLDAEGVKDFSGVASYKTTFLKPQQVATSYDLQLGVVHATAEVRLNGHSLGSLIGPLFHVNIPANLLKDENELEVVVANLMANRIAYMDRQQIPWKIFYNTNMPARLKENSKNGLFNAAHWSPLPSGLLGPVTLTPLK